MTSVYDGDTFTLETGDKIRLRLVNTPELRPREPLGDEARAFADDFVNGQEVRLEFDPRNPRDSYGRVVARVTAPKGDLAMGLLKEGLGHVFVIPPETVDMTPYLAAQAEARAARRGIWAEDMFSGALHFTSFHADAPGDDDQNVNGEYMRICNLLDRPVDLQGWRLEDIGGGSHVLPALTVPAGHTVQVRSGKGTNQADPRAQLEVFLQSSSQLWNNDREEVTLYDPSGRATDRRASP